MKRYRFISIYKTETNEYKEIRNPFTNRTTHYLNGKRASGQDKYTVENVIANAPLIDVKTTKDKF